MRFFLLAAAAATLLTATALARPGATCGAPAQGETIVLTCDDGSWVDGVRAQGKDAVTGFAVSCRKPGDTGASEWKSWGETAAAEEGMCPLGSALTGLSVAAMQGFKAIAHGTCAAEDKAMGWWSGASSRFKLAAADQSSCNARCVMGGAWHAVTLVVSDGRIARLTPDCSNTKR